MLIFDPIEATMKYLLEERMCREPGWLEGMGQAQQTCWLVSTRLQECYLAEALNNQKTAVHSEAYKPYKSD